MPDTALLDVKAIDAFGRIGPADNTEAWLFLPPEPTSHHYPVPESLFEDLLAPVAEAVLDCYARVERCSFAHSVKFGARGRSSGEPRVEAWPGAVGTSYCSWDGIVKHATGSIIIASGLYIGYRERVRYRALRK
jgi:hypothetical protein